MPAADERAPGGDDPRFARAVAAIDQANAADPVRIQVDGEDRAKELVHADAVERWLRRLEPEPSDEQLLAARAHHLRRWVVPRTDYPEGRAGYLRWRTDHKRRQAEEVSTILRDAGYDDATIERVADLVAKKGAGRDPQAQVHEDALCLTFLELQADDLTEHLGQDHMVEVVRKTTRKMSPAAIGLVAEVPLGQQAQAAVAAGTAPHDEG